MAISWICAVLILLAYFRGGRLYDWANLLLFLPVAWPALRAHAYSSVSLSFAFGIIAAWRLLWLR